MGVRLTPRVAAALALVLLAACGGSDEPRPRSAATTVTSRQTSTTTAPAVATSTATKPPASPSQPKPAPRDAYVNVAVATLWRSPDSPRAVDAPALRAPPDIRGWLSSLTLAQRKGLEGRVDSQLLLGDRVLVIDTRGDWANVTAPGQPNPTEARGYPGWIPTPQLTFDPPPRSNLEATVVAPTAWLTDNAGRRVLEVSMGTRLPVKESGSSTVTVAGPGGAALRFQASDVSVTAPGAAALAPSAASVVRVARMFEGLPYLWGGTSGFGFDCSGLTHLVYRLHGVVIPRDADAQANAGTPVARDALRPGDLLFYARRAFVYHVSMAIDGGRMIQSPQAGKSVEVVPTDSKPYAPQYHGARRYL